MKEKRSIEKAKVAQKSAKKMGVVDKPGVATGILIAPKFRKQAREDFKKKIKSQSPKG